MTLTQYEKIGLCFQEAREAADKTQQEVARFLGCTYQAVSNWERGRTKIDSVSLLKCLLWFDTDLFKFLENCDFDVLRRYGDGDPIQEHELLASYRKLNEEGRQKLLDNADDLVQSGKYIKTPALSDAQEA